MMLNPVHLLETKSNTKQAPSININFRVVAHATPNCPKDAILKINIAARGYPGETRKITALKPIIVRIRT